MVKQSDISKLEQLAASQWGMFTTAQAQTLGFRRNQIARMVDSVRVEPMCYGVYRFVAGSEPAHADLKAAWLSAFPKKTATERLSERPFDAVAAVGTAATALGAGDFHLSPYTFITATRRQTAREDMRFLSCSLDKSDVVMIDSLPTTSFERTVFDLLRLNEDPSLVDDFMRDAARNHAHTFDRKRLSKLLDPIASRYGFPEGGESFAADLILRNVSEVLFDKVLAVLQSKASGVCESKGFQDLAKIASTHLFEAQRKSGFESNLATLFSLTGAQELKDIASAMANVAKPRNILKEDDKPAIKEA